MAVFAGLAQAYPVAAGVVSLITAGPSVGDQIAAATTAIVNQIEANQSQQLGGQAANELQWFTTLARNPCNAAAFNLWSQNLYATGQTFETLRLVVLGSNPTQAENLVPAFNVIGALYLSLLRGSTTIGSYQCGGPYANGIAPFDSQTFADILMKIKQTNYDLIGAQAEYHTTEGSWTYPVPLPFQQTWNSMRNSHLYTSVLFANRWIYSPVEVCQWRCNVQTGACQSLGGPVGITGGSCVYTIAYAEADYLPSMQASVDALFNADGTVNFVRGAQEQILSYFPNYLNDDLGFRGPGTILPVTPIPIFQETPMVGLANPPNGFDLFYRSSFQNLVHTFGSNNSAIIKTANLGGTIIGSPAAERISSTIDAYAKGTDSVVYHWSGPANLVLSGWSGYDSTGLVVFDDPVAPATVATGSEGREVFGNSQNLRTPTVSVGNAPPSSPSWSLFSSAPGEFHRTAPAVVGMNGIEYLFDVGVDGTLQYGIWFPGPGLNFGRAFGNALGAGRVIGAPVATSWGANRLDVFAIGRQDQAPWHRAFNGASWEPWESLGGMGISKPAVVSAFGPGRIDLFVTGTDHNLYQNVCIGTGCDGTGWLGYFYMGSTPNGIIGNPVVVSPGPNLIDIIVVDASGTLYHKSWTGSQWAPSQTGYWSLAGAAVATD